MKRILLWFFIGLLLLEGVFLFSGAYGAEKKEGYLLPGDVKEGWKVFNEKKCGACHAIWGEGGKGGPDLGTLPESYVSQSQLVALMWDHGPAMWEMMLAKKIHFEKISDKEMADLFSFLYFLRYMDEPGDPRKGKALVDRACGRCHAVKGGTGSDLSRWGMYTNPILWAQMMWNHSIQMEKEMRKIGLSWVEFKGSEMVDLIAYIRSLNPNAEKVYLSPGDPRSGERLFGGKGCIQCHSRGSQMDLAKRKDFPRTLVQLAGMMWNHSPKMWREMEKKGMERPALTAQEMADLVAYLFSTRYFDEPGDPERGKSIFVKKQCNLCHGKEKNKIDLSGLKGRISPILMAMTMWNHGPQMLEKMRKAKVPWQRIDGKEMVDLMEYLNRGTP